LPRFKLKSTLRFTPEGSKYLIHDDETQSRFRVGETEYRILRHFEETNNVEEVGYAFLTGNGINIPSQDLHGFIQQAIALNLLEEESDSIWGRLRSIKAFSFRVRLFDPNKLINILIEKSAFLLNPIGLAALVLSSIASTIILIRDFSELWAFHSFALPTHYIVVMGIVFLLSIGHELAHALAARKVGFEVAEVGFHLHYFLPAFYCKIFRRQGADLRSVLIVLISGSLFDLALINFMALAWLGLPADIVAREWLSVAISLLLIKVLLIQMNPLWPYSDGFHIFSALVSKVRSRNRE
jgi:putative peptide zinc metalloprotease protein